ncbi:MAG: PPC domain-containing protein [Cyanobacteriota bacterium]|nr:PPC domain-containing protein [Cyanobacteriota bacterium]
MIPKKYLFTNRFATAVLSLSLVAIATPNPFMQGGKGVAFAQPNGSPILQEEGVLEEGDTVLEEDGSLYDIYTFEGSAGQSVVIAAESSDFDTYVLVADSEGNILGENDDISEEDTNSRLEVTLPSDGTYNAIVNGFEASDRGSYILTISE